MARRVLTQSVAEQVFHIFQPVSHLVEFGHPGAAQFVVIQNQTDDRGAVVRWHRINRTHQVVHLTVDDIPRSAVAGQKRQRSHPVAIQAEILRTRRCYDHLRYPSSHMANQKCIVVNVVSKSLVSHIDKWHQTALDDNVGDRLPFIL